MEEGVLAPSVYVMSRKATEGLIETALAAFSITPLSCVIISDMKDYHMARKFGDLVLRVKDEDDSILFAVQSFEETNMPSLVIGSRIGICAIYSNGRTEDLPWQEANLRQN